MSESDETGSAQMSESEETNSAQMLDSDDAGSAQIPLSVDDFSTYVTEWSRLVEMDFEASLGELSSDGNGNFIARIEICCRLFAPDRRGQQMWYGANGKINTVTNSMSTNLCGSAVRIHAMIAGSTQA